MTRNDSRNKANGQHRSNVRSRNPHHECHLGSGWRSFSSITPSYRGLIVPVFSDHPIHDAILKSAMPRSPETLPESRRCLVVRLNIPGTYKLILQGEETVVFEEKSAIQPGEAHSLNPNQSQADGMSLTNKDESLA